MPDAVTVVGEVGLKSNAIRAETDMLPPERCA